MIYLWLLLTLPQDKLICELWTRNIPDQPALVRACGTEELEKFRLDVTRDGIGICSVPAASLPWVRDDCNLTAPLDQYRLRIVEPDYQTAICSVRTPTNTPPAWDVIAGQCPNAKQGAYEMRMWTTIQPTPEPAPVCKPPPPPQTLTIATSETYHNLAAKLIWYGLAKSACPNGQIGVNPATWSVSPCALDGARPVMLAWQNGLDDAILVAAREWNVPADLLKRIIARETQFWSWTGTDGEHGMIQITEDGAGVVMHVYQPGYYRMTIAQQYNARIAWLKQLDCINCSPVQAYEHAKKSMARYAQALAAYYCMYGSWDAAIEKWNIKHSKH